MAEDSAPNLQNALRQRGGIQRPTRGTAKARPTKKEGKGIGNVMAGLNWFASMADQAIVNALWADSKPSQRPQKPRKRSRERLNKVQGNDNTSLKGSNTDATRLAGQLPSASEGESHRLPRRPGPAVSLPDASGGQASQAFGSLQAKGPGQQAVANPAPKRAGTPVNAPRMSLPEKGPQPSNKPQIPSLEIAPRSVSVESLPRSVSVDSSHGLELEPAPRGVSLDSVSNEVQDVSQDSHRSGTLARHTDRTHASRVPSRDSVARRHALVERASSVDSQSGRPISLKPAPRPARDVRSIAVPAGGDDCDDAEDIEGCDACDHLETMQGEASSANAKIEEDGPEVEAETTASVE